MCSVNKDDKKIVNSRINRLLVGILLSVFILLSSACGETAPEVEPTLIPQVPGTNTPEPTVTLDARFKILFVGNSLTYWNNGLAYHMEGLVESADLPFEFQADEVYKLGAPLKTMWEETKARELITEGDYDVVVLQGGLPSSGLDSFHEYTRRFVTEIKETGAEPVLFMTWSRSGISIEEISQAYGDIAKELGVDVAPVGLAWHRAMEENPELNLFDLDKVHPSTSGTYLTVNIFYTMVFGENPFGLDYLPTGVTAEQGSFLQRVAWETVQSYLSTGKE